jgi:hypothetical protein
MCFTYIFIGLLYQRAKHAAAAHVIFCAKMSPEFVFGSGIYNYVVCSGSVGRSVGRSVRG